MFTAMTIAPGKCKYCDAEAPTNDERLCGRCAGIVTRVRSKGRASGGRKPTLPSAKNGFTKIKARGTGLPCAICDEPITVDHFTYRKTGDREWDLHFHELCERIWQMETIVAERIERRNQRS
jgi:hypothetical protein